MRQAYDYWQDQPGSLIIFTLFRIREHTPRMRSGTLTQKSFRIICAFFPFKLKLLELLFDIQLGRDFTELILAYTIATNQKNPYNDFQFCSKLSVARILAKELQSPRRLTYAATK